MMDIKEKIQQMEHGYMSLQKLDFKIILFLKQYKHYSKL